MTSPMILPGLHPGLSRDQYDAIDAVNQSALKVLIERSPAHFKYAKENPEPPTDALRFGQAVHLACYEPARFAAEVVMMPEFNRKSNAGKAEAAAWEAANAGKLAIDAEEYATLAAMQKAVQAHPAASKLIGKAGHREASMVWRDADTGVLCKGRADHSELGGSLPPSPAPSHKSWAGFRDDHEHALHRHRPEVLRVAHGTGPRR